LNKSQVLSANTDLCVCVVHYSPLVERKRYLSENLKDFSSVTWVDEKNLSQNEKVNSLDSSILGVSELRLAKILGINSRSLVYSRKRARIQAALLLLRSYINLHRGPEILGALPSKSRLPKPWLELIQMHLKALKLGMETGLPFLLILEDDAVLDKGFRETLEHIINSNYGKDSWINLNSGAGLVRTKSDPVPNEFGMYRVSPPATRCATSYIISRGTAARIIALFEVYGIPSWLPIDFLYQAAVLKLKLKTYWQDPPCIIQGSESGAYKSNFENLRSDG